MVTSKPIKELLNQVKPIILEAGQRLVNNKNEISVIPKNDKDIKINQPVDNSKLNIEIMHGF